MPTSGDFKSGDTIKDQHTPPPPRPNSSMRPPIPRKFIFDLDPPPSNFAGKKVDLSVRDFNWSNTSSNQTLAYIRVAKKKLPSFCL